MPTAVVTTDYIVRAAKDIDFNNSPKEESIEVSKKIFYEEFMKYAESIGLEAMHEHPCVFVQDVAYDLYREQDRSKATKILREWESLTDAN